MPGLRSLLGVIMFEFPDELNLPIIYDDGGYPVVKTTWS